MSDELKNTTAYRAGFASVKFDPDQPRDESGRFAGGGSSSGSADRNDPDMSSFTPAAKEKQTKYLEASGFTKSPKDKDLYRREVPAEQRNNPAYSGGSRKYEEIYRASSSFNVTYSSGFVRKFDNLVDAVESIDSRGK